jgi:hypothetical protein
MERPPTLAASLANSAAALPPEGAQRAAWDGPAPRMERPPTLAASLANSAAALPPQGAQRAAWDGPAPRAG